MIHPPGHVTKIQIVSIEPCSSNVYRENVAQSTNVKISGMSIPLLALPAVQTSLRHRSGFYEMKKAEKCIGVLGL